MKYGTGGVDTKLSSKFHFGLYQWTLFYM